MKIEKIDIISSFTKFKNKQRMDFSKNKKNCAFIYGSNGTGKSSLSRLFFISNMKFDNNGDYESKLLLLKTINSKDEMGVKICYDDGTETSFTNDLLNPKKIPVFNKDYIDTKITYQSNFKNNKFQEQALNYGIELESKTNYNIKSFEVEENRKSSLELSEKINQKIESAIIQTIKDTGTTRANQKYTIEYNQRHFSSLNPKDIPNDGLDKLRDKHKMFISSLKDISENDSIKFILYEFNDFEILEKNILSINETIKFNEDKTKLDFVKQYLDKFEEEVKDWKIKGAYLIKDSKCPFCEQDTSNIDIVKMYQNYIKSKLRKTESFISDQIKYFENENKNIDMQYSINEAKAKNIDKIFQTDITIQINDYVEDLKKFNLDIIKVLKEKEKDESIYIDCTNSLPEIDLKKLKTLFDNYSKLLKNISEVNNKITNASTEKKKINEEYLDTTGMFLVYNMVRAEIGEFKKLIVQSKKLNEELEVLKKVYQDEVKDKNELLKIINSILDDFSITNYRIDENFDLFLNDCEVSENVEKLLSDGEKNIIAFALFISELKLLYTENEKQIVFIDDPITSVDYPNLYSVYNYIIDIIAENNKSQIIITSHNIIFLNLFKFYFRGNALYFKLKEDSNSETNIYEDTDIYDSIYLEKLKEIYKISISKNITPRQKLYIHNYCRYVIETLSRFEYPNYKNDSSSSQYYIEELKKQIKNNPSILNVSKNNLDILSNIINKGSHATLEIVHDSEFFEDKHYLKCCNTIIEIIRTKYNGQYQLLTFDATQESMVNETETTNE